MQISDNLTLFALVFPAIPRKKLAQTRATKIKMNFIILTALNCWLWNKLSIERVTTATNFWSSESSLDKKDEQKQEFSFFNYTCKTWRNDKTFIIIHIPANNFLKPPFQEITSEYWNLSFFTPVTDHFFKKKMERFDLLSVHLGCCQSSMCLYTILLKINDCDIYFKEIG